MQSSDVGYPVVERSIITTPKRNKPRYCRIMVGRHRTSAETTSLGRHLSSLTVTTFIFFRALSSPSSKLVLNAQERKLDKSEAEPGNEYDIGEPDYENHEPANRKGIDRSKIVNVDAKERHMGQICAVRNPAEENERWKIQKGWSSSL
jgi:hypothetical protein